MTVIINFCPQLFAISDLPPSSGLAVDWLSRCIYITQDDEIYRYDTTISTESALTTITENETSSYLGVVVDPAKRYIFLLIVIFFTQLSFALYVT